MIKFGAFGFGSGAGSAGGGVQNGYELLTEFDYQMFNSNVGEPSVLISNIPLPSVSHFIEEAVLVEVLPLDVDSINQVSIRNPVTTNFLFTVNNIDKLTLFVFRGGPQESTVNVEVQGPAMTLTAGGTTQGDPIEGGNTQGEYKVFVKYGQIPN